MRKCFYVLLLLCSTFISCNKSLNKTPVNPLIPNNTDSIANPSIYIAGSIGDVLNSNAVYWKNDSVHYLTQNSQGAYANGIAVSGSDIYVAGGPYNDIGYWKNGTFVSFNAVGTQSTGPILISGDSILELSSDYQFTSNIYYLNGQATMFDKNPDSAYASAIAVSGTSIYTCGVIYKNNISTAGYWRNGAFTALTDGTRNASANDMKVVGSDLYVCGWEMAAVGPYYIAKYWKNGVPVILSDSLHVSWALKIVVSGNDVVVAGFQQPANRNYNVVKYWKNGDAVNLTDSSAERVVTGLAVNGSDVYVSFYDFGFNVTPNYPKYSKNNSIFSLTDGTQTAVGLGICLTK